MNLAQTPTSIEKAAEACRASFAAHPEATYAWCVHHEVLFEKLVQPFEDRIDCILRDKPQCERIIRLNNFRPVVSLSSNTLENFTKARETKAWKTYETAHAKAWETYEADQAKAWETYEATDAKARDKAWKTYDAAHAKAWETCKTDQAKAWETYEAARAKSWERYDAAYRKDVPNGTWDGKSIFGK
jgi:hypothetical protein